MSGHSHWHSIRHKKAITDSRRGKLFSMLSRAITIAAKNKGGDPESNPALRTAIEKAKQANMPNDNIEKAIKKGTGEIEGAQMEEFTYEAYGPSGVAIIIEGITDNKNRALSEIKHILSQHNSKMAAAGSVVYQFDKTNDGWDPKYPFSVADDKTKEQIIKLFEALDEQDDVADIYSNAENL